MNSSPAAAVEAAVAELHCQVQPDVSRSTCLPPSGGTPHFGQTELSAAGRRAGSSEESAAPQSLWWAGS